MDMRSGTVGKWAGERAPDLLKRKPRKAAHAHGLGEVPIAREESRRADTRDEDRVPLHGERFRISHCRRDLDVEVINLSGGGAMIATDLKPNLAERIHLHLGQDGTVECVVRWIKDGRLGLEFAHETQLDCTDDERSAVLRAVLERAFPHAAAVPDDSEQRIARRHPLIWSGELRSNAGSWAVRLRNVSATGTLVQCAKPLPLGRPLELDLGNAGTLGVTVSWSVGDHAGLAFDEPFDMRRLSHSKPRVAPARWLRPAYLEQDVPDNSAWDDAWSRMSVDELKTELEGFLKR
jgi:PilZ domain-containing protein